MPELDFSDIPKHILSANEIRQYSECARKRYYASRDHLAVRPTKTGDALLLGKKIHEMFEHYYLRGQKAIEKLAEIPDSSTGEFIDLDAELPEDFVREALELVEPFQLSDEDTEALGSNLAVFNCIHKNYVEGRLVEDLCKYEPLASEMEFKLNHWPIDEVQYHGQIDLIVRERGTRKIWFMEHKSSRDFRPEIYNRFDIQLHIYTVVGHNYCNAEDCEWGGIILNEVKKAKTERGYAEHRMYYTYNYEEMASFTSWLTAKTKAAVSPTNVHEPCNTYMTCKMCEYANICLKYGYEVPQTHEELTSMLDPETNEPLYKYDPREEDEENE